MAFAHTYNADPSQSGMFGNGWSFSYDQSLSYATYSDATSDRSIALVSLGTGKGVSFTHSVPKGTPPSPPTAYDPDGGNFDYLTREADGSWSYEPKGSHTLSRFEQILPPTGDYSAKAHLTSVTDANGNEVVIERNPDATINTVTDAVGRVTSFSYADFGGAPRCTLMTTPDGRTASYSYDSSGNLVGSVDLLGTTTTYTYDADNFLTSLSVAGSTTLFTYSGSGDDKLLASITDAEGHVITCSKDSNQPITTIRDEGGNAFTYGTSTEDPKTTTAVTDPYGKTTTTVQGPAGPAEIYDSWGYHIYMEYDARGNLTRLERPHAHVVTSTYDADDNLLTRTDAYDKTWTYQYDANHNLIRRVSPSGDETVLTYDGKGQVVSATDSGGNTTTFTYDPFGNVLTMTDPLANVTSYTYDTPGLHLLSRTDPQGRTTSYTYDNNDRVTKITYADGRSVQYRYDEAVLVARTNEAGQEFQHQPNKVLASTKVADALGNNTLYGYDGNGNMTFHQDPLGNISRYSYDGNGNQIAGIDPLGHTQSYTYDDRGVLTGFTDERGHTTNFLFDGNRFLSYVWDDIGYINYTYDKVGRILSRASARGNTGQTYNDDGQLHQILHNGVPAGTFSYDAAGNMAGFTDWAGTTSFSHDARKRMTGITYPDGHAVSFSLLPDGKPETIHYPGGMVVSYTYDERQRITAISWPGGAISIDTDPVGRVTSLTRSNGTTSNYAYDANGRILSISHARDSVPFATLSYARDAAGNVIQETADLPIDPVIPDLAGTNTYNAANQLVSFEGNPVSYDLDGNLTAMGDSRGLSASYDAENRLTSLSLSSVESTFSYNLPGQRVKIVRNSSPVNLHPDPRNRLLFETDAADSVTALYIYSGPRPLAMLRGGETYFYHYDQRASTVALTDSAGAVAAAYIHSPFGLELGRSGNVANPFTWLGGLGVMDDGDGIYFMTNRHYDASARRFMQKDPSGFTGGHNLYAYAANNPLNLVDPLGLNYIGDATAVGNMTIGIMVFAAQVGAAITAPTWGGVALCGVGIGLGVARLVSVFDNAEYYKNPEYGFGDSAADFVDPTRFLRNTFWPDTPTNDTDYGNMKTSTPYIGFSEFTPGLLK